MWRRCESFHFPFFLFAPPFYNSCVSFPLFTCISFQSSSTLLLLSVCAYEYIVDQPAKKIRVVSCQNGGLCASNEKALSVFFFPQT